MDKLPSYVSVTFMAIVISVFAFLFYAIKAASSSKKSISSSLAVSAMASWIVLICTLTFQNFFQDLSMPPCLMIFMGIPVLSIIMLFSAPKSRRFLKNMPITTLHYIHIVRVPVEMVLWWLSVWQYIPQTMTFEGHNLDIISGISAPFAAVFMVGNRSKNTLAAVIWNLVALGLLLRIVTQAIKLTPYFHPENTEAILNTGVFQFPYILLPTFIVPAIFLSHLISLYQLIFKKK